ncbi:MAG: universal stress protein [Kouleothrix sp.]|jgi:nucleotide-binding universal stress UspA family protein|nr:universal stress protein [Kouleothrix sp.]
MFKRVLLTTDGSPVVERQILYAEHLARVEHAELFVLHAYELPARYAEFSGYDQLSECFQAVAQALADDAASALRDDGFAATSEVRVGPAGDAIIAAAKEYDIDLIVMGTRSGSNLQAMLGSVSAYVLRHAHCPVLQIP